MAGLSRLPYRLTMTGLMFSVKSFNASFLVIISILLDTRFVPYTGIPRAGFDPGLKLRKLFVELYPYFQAFEAVRIFS